MLEIRNLVKIYTTKGGEPVRAIDGVSARFRETGMVFLLGKSGSGKSTLLNLCGGLDTPDEGEIIIKGRSSKDFSPSDFDSYRNTYVGFIFQEYNILEEFTVADNIALALELQGKNKAQDAVERILEEVDLAGCGNRKPNTLSGGQRQRVAIARALVKDPEIIMADEPTGALDSETGKQVLDTLKKLSRTKLVLVVTHDREFAEMYGDRIIELKDGKIISDVTRTEQGATEENIRFTDDVIAIRSGAQLTARDLEKINAFLARREEPIVITAEKQSVERVLCDACLEEGSAAFSGTDETRIAAKTYTAEESRFIRSRLPLSRAIRIGASSMRVKPVRLAFTIFLSVLSFIMFGLFSTLTFFDRAETSLRTYRDLGYEMLSLINNYQYRNTSYVDGKESESWAESRTTLFTTDDYEALRDQFGPDTIGIYNYGSIGSTRKFVPENVRSPASYSARYYYAGISGLRPSTPPRSTGRGNFSRIPTCPPSAPTISSSPAIPLTASATSACIQTAVSPGRSPFRHTTTLSENRSSIRPNRGKMSCSRCAGCTAAISPPNLTCSKTRLPLPRRSRKVCNSVLPWNSNTACMTSALSATTFTTHI